MKNKKENINLAIDFLKTISERNRFRILYLLRENKRCVGKICRELDLPQNLVSHHLKVLKNFGLISSEQEGVRIFYKTNPKIIKKYLKLVNEIL